MSVALPAVEKKRKSRVARSWAVKIPLAALAVSKGARAFHLEDAECIDVAAGTLRHQAVRAKLESVEAAGWLGEAKIIGLTAGASTPNNKAGETVVRICQMVGLSAELEKSLA